MVARLHTCAAEFHEPTSVSHLSVRRGKGSRNGLTPVHQSPLKGTVQTLALLVRNWQHFSCGGLNTVNSYGYKKHHKTAKTCQPPNTAPPITPAIRPPIRPLGHKRPCYASTQTGGVVMARIFPTKNPPAIFVPVAALMRRCCCILASDPDTAAPNGASRT